MSMPMGGKNPSGFLTDVNLDANGNIKVAVSDVSNNAAINKADGDAGGNAVGQLELAHIYGFNGATWDRSRTPSKYLTAVATAAGNSALWTPAAGKKFRLQAYRIVARADAIMAVAAINTIALQDNATTIAVAVHDVWIPSVAGTNNQLFDSGWIDLKNGILSAAINQVLNINLGTAITGGNVRAYAMGTEE